MKSRTILLIRTVLSLTFSAVAVAGCSTQPVALVSTPKVATKHAHAEAPKAKKHTLHKQENGVLSLDVFKENNNIHILTGINDQDFSTLQYQRSNDQGQSWTTPVNIAPQGTVFNFHRGNDSQVAAWGDNVVVAWMNRGYTNRHGSGPMSVAYSHDQGKTWGLGEMAASRWKNGAHAFMALAANDKGMHFVWLDSRNGKQGLQYAHSTNGGETWKPETTLDAKTCYCCWNTLASDSHNNLYALYRDKEPSDMALIKVEPENGTPKRVARVGEFDWDFQGCPHVGGALAVHEQGNQVQLHAMVGTMKPEKAGLYYLSSADGGSHWSPEKRMGQGMAVHSDIAVNDSGELLASWDVAGPMGMSIITRKSLDQGQTWLNETALSAPDVDATHPKVVAVNEGFLVFWTEKQEGGSKQLQIKKVN
ncbi:MAG: sialidase family protein [Methylococcales bacterium]